MSVGRTVRSVFQTLSNMYFARTFEKISLTDQLYPGVPKVEITLVSHVGGEGLSMKLSVSEARQVLQSIKKACDLNDVVEIKVGELTWKTDARPRSKDLEKILIKFNSPAGFVRTPAKREQVTTAMNEFLSKFGPD